MRSFAAALLWPAAAAAVPVSVPHQGRLLDASGAPLQGSHALTFELRDGTGPGAAVLWRSTLTLDLSDGYYATVLDLDEGGQPLDSDVFAGDTWLRVSSAAGLLGEQHVGTVPRAAVALSVSGAVVASGANVVQLGQSTASTCAADGSLIYDPDLEAVKLCVAGAWRVITSERGPRAGFESSGGAWRWDDGTSPSACKGYLTGVAPVGRGSVPGNDAEDTGLYHITVGGTPRVVWCDMHAEGGGWTLTYAFGRTLSPTTVYSGQSGRFPQGDNWVMPRTDGVGWFLAGAPSTAWIVTVQPNCAQDPTCSNAFTVARSEGQTDSWVWIRAQLGQNNVVVEYPDGTTYTEINWTAWDRGYNGGDDGARCGGHIWWYDYTTANPFYMPSRTSTACLHASGKAVFFWAR